MADRLRTEARQEPKPFRRATDGASKSPVMAEKHRASDRAFRFLRSDVAPGAPFLWLLSLGVKESDPRDSAEWFGEARKARTVGDTEPVKMPDDASH